MAIDPVCGMKLEEGEAVARVAYRGKVYYFCSGGCRREFDADPMEYFEEEERPAGAREVAGATRKP